LKKYEIKDALLLAVVLFRFTTMATLKMQKITFTFNAYQNSMWQQALGDNFSEIWNRVTVEIYDCPVNLTRSKIVLLTKKVQKKKRKN